MLPQCKKHLDSVNESYFQHLFFTLKYAGCCFLAGFVVVLHGLIPGLFEKDASTLIRKLADKSEKNTRGDQPSSEKPRCLESFNYTI